MREYSIRTRRYIVGLILVSGIMMIWELAQLPQKSFWLYPMLAAQGLLTYAFKRQDPAPHTIRWVSLALVVLGLGLVSWQLHRLPEQSIWTLLGVSALAAAAHLLKQPGATKQSSYQTSFVVYGFALVLLGSPATVFVILVAHLIEYTCGSYYPWYIQSFNVATFVLAVSVAGFVERLASPDQMFLEPLGLLGILIAFGAFVMVNSLLVGNVLRLARGQSFRESGVFDRQTLMIDLSHLCMGAGTALIWRYSPFAVVINVIPLQLVYSALRVPALERQSEVDPKTGLYNARYFKRELESELDRANRFDRPLALVMADLDLLRNINNSYGHLAGDIVLQGVAEHLQQLSRHYDTVARFGGEEFAILFPETTPEMARHIAERMRAAIATTEFTLGDNRPPIQATMSFGVAGRDHPEQSYDALVHHADLALYQAKENGRNQVVRFSDE